MSVEGNPYSELLSPLLIVVGAIYLLAPMLPRSRPWARGLVFAIVWLVIARYLDWRVFITVVPATGEWYEVGWVYFCFAVEALALFDALILYLAFLRTRTVAPKQMLTRDGCALCPRSSCLRSMSTSRRTMNR